MDFFWKQGTLFDFNEDRKSVGKITSEISMYVARMSRGHFEESSGFSIPVAGIRAGCQFALLSTLITLRSHADGIEFVDMFYYITTNIFVITLSQLRSCKNYSTVGYFFPAIQFIGLL